MINLTTPEGIAEYFESMKNAQKVSIEAQLAKSFTPVSKVTKKKRTIGFKMEEEK